MERMSIEQLQAFKHYWMFNKSWDGNPVWRIMYVIEDDIYPYGPKAIFLLFHGDEKRFPPKYFSDFKELYFIEVIEPKEKIADDINRAVKNIKEKLDDKNGH